jgi:glycosyltransferase involved in cell wall biosynthesis
LVTEDWYFCSHRLQLACAARDAGYDVGVVTQVTRHGEMIERAGLKLFPIPFSRSGRQPLQDLRTTAAINRIYRAEKPQLVHHVSMKPILYGALAARVSGVPRVINAYTGLGFLFSDSRRARALRGLLTRVWRPLLGSERCWSIVQNPDDMALLEKCGWLQSGRTTLIPGSGVDTNAFHPTDEVKGMPCVVLAARMLWDKGVGEFVAAARQLRTSGVQARFVLVGEPDPENPRSVKTEDLQRWQGQGDVEWWGRREDMAEVLRQAHVVCLPSYREGLPKVLLEAMASARAIVATDVPGCREVVRYGENGLLVPPRDSGALAAAIKELLSLRDRRAMGRCGRRMVEEHFSIDRVIADTLLLYERVLGCS